MRCVFKVIKKFRIVIVIIIKIITVMIVIMIVIIMILVIVIAIITTIIMILHCYIDISRRNISVCIKKQSQQNAILLYIRFSDKLIFLNIAT